MKQFKIQFLIAALSLFVPALFTASTAFADASSLRLVNIPDNHQTNLQAEEFEPLPGPGANILNIATNDLAPSLRPTAGLFLHYLKSPVTSADKGDIIESQLKAELGLSLGLFNYAEIYADLPFIAYQNEGKDYKDYLEANKAYTKGFPLATPLNSMAFQDLRAGVKVRFIDPSRLWAHGFGLGLMVTGYFPIPVKISGKSDYYNQFASFKDKDDDPDSYLKAMRVEPRLILDWRHAGTGIKVAGNVGFQYRPLRTYGFDQTASELRWGAGLEVPIPKVEWIHPEVSFFGSYPFISDTDKTEAVKKINEQAKTIGLSERYTKSDIYPISNRELDAGLKFYLPYNFVAQVGGGAGISGALGNPKYRIFAGLAYSPVAMAADDDGDGVINTEDKCPSEYGPKEHNGCPWGDRDGDGILDNVDKCPNDIEDFDGYQDEDGCPDPDNDEDGIPDGQDNCPNAAGPLENNGCPWGDKDNDGIPDNQDKCPDQPETVNNYQDDDGCPDTPPPPKPSKVRLTSTKIEILDKVYFNTGKATIKPESDDLLDQVADVLKDTPKITKLRVEGHTDSRGSKRKNKKLSQDRANAVRDYLINQGVEADRLEAKGYGPDVPIASNKTADGREQNRRVEFTIIGVDGKPVNTNSVTVTRKVKSKKKGKKKKK